MATLKEKETVHNSGIHVPESSSLSVDSAAIHGNDYHDHGNHDHKRAFEVVEILRVLFVALAAAAVWFHVWEPFHRVSVIGLLATLIGG